MVCLAAMVSQKRKLRRQRLRRHLSSTLEHLRRYWHYKSVNDRENQAAGKHIPPSGDRRIGARGGWRFAEYCRDVYLDFFPDGALWDEDDLPLFNFDIDASATRWFYTACLDGDASVNQSHPNRVFKRFPEIAGAEVRVSATSGSFGETGSSIGGFRGGFRGGSVAGFSLGKSTVSSSNESGGPAIPTPVVSGS